MSGGGDVIASCPPPVPVPVPVPVQGILAPVANALGKLAARMHAVASAPMECFDE